MLDPQWIDCRPIEVEYSDADGVNELLVWCGFGSGEEFADEQVNIGWSLDFHGKVVAQAEGDGILVVGY